MSDDFDYSLANLKKFRSNVERDQRNQLIGTLIAIFLVAFGRPFFLLAGAHGLFPNLVPISWASFGYMFFISIGVGLTLNFKGRK